MEWVCHLLYFSHLFCCYLFHPFFFFYFVFLATNGCCICYIAKYMYSLGEHNYILWDCKKFSFWCTFSFLDYTSPYHAMCCLLYPERYYIDTTVYKSVFILLMKCSPWSYLVVMIGQIHFNFQKPIHISLKHRQHFLCCVDLSGKVNRNCNWSMSVTCGLGVCLLPLILRHHIRLCCLFQSVNKSEIHAQYSNNETK